MDEQQYYNPSRRLSDYDGAPFRSKRLPHPTTLSRWVDQGLIRFDVENGRIVLTDEGRQVARDQGAG